MDFNKTKKRILEDVDKLNELNSGIVFSFEESRDYISVNYSRLNTLYLKSELLVSTTTAFRQHTLSKRLTQCPQALLRVVPTLVIT